MIFRNCTSKSILRYSCHISIHCYIRKKENSDVIDVLFSSLQKTKTVNFSPLAE